MTGNLMRRIFRDHSELFAEVTGIPLVVIENTWTLYTAGASRLPIDPDTFSNLADETLRLYREALPWYPVNASFHRMQRHWPEMMRLLPPTISIGMLSEVEKINHYNRNMGAFLTNFLQKIEFVQVHLVKVDLRH